MAINTDLFVNIVSQLKDKGIKDTEKGLRGLSARTNTLTKQLGVLARRVAVFETLRRSFNAFVEDDAAARRLTVTLNNLGLSFSALSAEEYISNLERTSLVLDDQLRPAFESIARVTGDFAKTQSILNTAIDVAAGTGADVVTVSKALSRAYAGNTTSLSRLNAGLTKAELATGNFALVQDKLNTLFAGQNAELVDTYKGKVNSLKVAFANAGEAIGEGMIYYLEQLNNGDIQNGVNFIVKAGEAIGSVFRFAGKQIAFIKEIFTRKDFFSAEAQLEIFEKFSKVDDPAKVRASARERSKALQAEAKTAERIARLRAKEAAAAKAKAAAEKKAQADKAALSDAEKIFDDQRISLEAALQNEKLSENELLRLQLKKAILNENADRATILAAKLKESQAELMALEQFKPSNPFADWVGSLDEVLAKMAGIGVAVSPSTPGAIAPAAPIIPPSVVPPSMPNLAAGGVSREDLFDIFGGGAGFGGATDLTININSAQGEPWSDEVADKIVKTVVEASRSGFATNWYSTTARATL